MRTDEILPHRIADLKLTKLGLHDDCDTRHLLLLQIREHLIRGEGVAFSLDKVGAASNLSRSSVYRNIGSREEAIYTLVSWCLSQEIENWTLRYICSLTPEVFVALHKSMAIVCPLNCEWGSLSKRTRKAIKEYSEAWLAKIKNELSVATKEKYTNNKAMALFSDMHATVHLDVLHEETTRSKKFLNNLNSIFQKNVGTV